MSMANIVKHIMTLLFYIFLVVVKHSVNCLAGN